MIGRLLIGSALMTQFACSGGNGNEQAEVKRQVGVTLQAGEWERTTAPFGPGTNQIAGSPTSARFCLAAAQIGQPGILDALAGPAGECSENVSLSAGRIQGSRECVVSGVAPTRNTITGQFTPTTYEIEETIRDELVGDQREIARFRVTGRRIGDC